MSRPSLYSDELAATICEQIAAGKSLRTICEADGMPNRMTVNRWRRENDEFRIQYAYAREDRGDYYADMMVEVALERPPMVGDTNHQAGDSKSEDGNTRMDSAFVAWQRVQIDSYKWLASKFKDYAEKMDHTLSAPGGGPAVVRVLFGRD